MLMQTKEMIEKPEDIAKRFNAFQQNISSLGTWVSSESMQPLAIDYLLLSPAGQPLPKAGRRISFGVRLSGEQLCRLFL